MPQLWKGSLVHKFSFVFRSARSIAVVRRSRVGSSDRVTTLVTKPAQLEGRESSLGKALLVSWGVNVDLMQ